MTDQTQLPSSSIESDGDLIVPVSGGTSPLGDIELMRFPFAACPRQQASGHG